MARPDSDVSRHYGIDDLEERILDALIAAGKDPAALTVDDLAPVDAFHVRGRAATEELARWARIGEGDLVLDVGCGLGGTARYLATSARCEVVGLDLTEEYCRVAEALSRRVGLSECTHFRQGSAVDMPFGDRLFDVVWTEHVQMNVADKAAFYGELVRVLSPSGMLAFHDVFAGGEEGLHYPVPWAADASISHLAPAGEARRLLEAMGMQVVRWEDCSEEAEAFFDQVLQRVNEQGWMPLGLHLLMGDDASVKFANLRRNLAEGRVRIVQAVLRRGD